MGNALVWPFAVAGRGLRALHRPAAEGQRRGLLVGRAFPRQSFEAPPQHLRHSLISHHNTTKRPRTHLRRPTLAVELPAGSSALFATSTASLHLRSRAHLAEHAAHRRDEGQIDPPAVRGHCFALNLS